MSQQLAFYFDASACVGCKACQVACKDKKDNPIGVNYRRVRQYTTGSWTPHPKHPGVWVPVNVSSYHVSTTCMHCGEPICVEVCPSGAMTKNGQGVVVVDREKCVGCRLCQQACPYGAPQFREDLGVMTKCDLCADLRASGEQPACVAICPMRVLEVGELSELRAKYGDISGIEPLPDPRLTRPSFVTTPHRHSALSGQGQGKIRVEV